MKKIVFYLLFFCLMSQLWAQEATSPSGWYILKKGATYRVLSPNFMDMSVPYADVKNNTEKYKFVLSFANMNANEVVLKFADLGDEQICFDPYGRMLAIKGGLEKAPETDGACVGKLLQSINLPTGGYLYGSSFYWVLNQNWQKKTYTILLTGDMTIDVAMDKIELLPTQYQQLRNLSSEKVVK